MSSGDCSAERQEQCSPSGQACGKDEQSGAKDAEVHRQMKRIRHKILVLSGKGGVGKSTVAVNLALSLASAGHQVGLLDVDVHGPSVPELLTIPKGDVHVRDGKLVPVSYEQLHVMSLGFLLRGTDEAVIWRGPMKMGVIRQFLGDVDWGALDYLIIDCPPGTGDEPLSVVQLIDDATGALIVATPQDVALADVRRSITFCRQVSVPVLGVIENMSGFVCPACGSVTDIFRAGGGERMARDMGVPFLGRIPLDPTVVRAADRGRPFVQHCPETETAKAFQRIVRRLTAEGTTDARKAEPDGPSPAAKSGRKRVAFPLAAGRLAPRLGLADQCLLIDVDPDRHEVIERRTLNLPARQGAAMPRWLAGNHVDVVVALQVRSRAQVLLAEQNISVISDVQTDDPNEAVAGYLAGKLES